MAIKITEALLAEHVVFHSLFDTLEQMLPRIRSLNEIRALAEVLESMLGAHSKVEDRLIMEPLDHCFEEFGQQETFHEEHEEIDAALALCLKSRDLRKARRLLMDVVVAARSHFDKEERLVFPLAEKALNTKTLVLLGERWKEERKAIVG